ncbi:hypothetical protein L804_05766, partial [Cryptococcus deuterogattii 2001/935-1]
MSYSDLPHKPTIPVEPFKLSIPDEDIKVPHILLKSTRIAKESYENVSAENNKRKQEEGINSLPAFKAKFKKSEDSVFSIHFTALFSKKTYAIPIILSHGWPG